MLEKKRRVLIDTDTASDDAVALLMALRSPEIEVAAITMVAGNVELEQATANALYTLELCNAVVPVYKGAAQPMLRSLQLADWFHGKDGLGDHGYIPTRSRAESEHAVPAILRTVRKNPGLEIITLGPLTNLAQAVLEQPDLVANVSRCVIMGGAACTEGNVTPAGEFNIWVDPEAAEIVFRSGLPIEMIGWELSRHDAALHAADIEQILALKNPVADFAIRCNSTAESAFERQTGQRGIGLPDPVAMAVLLNPNLILRSSEHFVMVETRSELTRGMTVVDRLNVATDERNAAIWGRATAGRKARICWELDIPGWKQALIRALTQ